MENSAITSADATNLTGAGNSTSATFTFVDAAGGDYHLAPSDVGALGRGADLSNDPDLSFANDIDGDRRTGAWDLGADQH